MANAYDRIIGYDTIKTELMQISDMVRNPDIYKKIGAKLPKGILLYGRPGLGKSLMAKCFLEDCGLKTYTLRRNKASEDFVDEITKAFRDAGRCEPAIIFLDDMDKFANEDEDHRDAEEYVAIQAGIDEVKDKEVLVLATANDIRKLPPSLKRAGRFDRKIEVDVPSEEDANRIIEYYLSKKNFSDDVNTEDLANMISYNSCAELETIINEAAIYAAYERKEKVEMEHAVKAVLMMKYKVPADYNKTPGEEDRKTAAHEAGHLVIAETLKPGSVGLVSIRVTGDEHREGFIHVCKDVIGEADIMVSLAGKVATEMLYPDECAKGCTEDLDRAAQRIRDYISTDAGAGFGMYDISNGEFSRMTENFISRNEAVVHAELERYMRMTRSVLYKNRAFLEKTVEELMSRETLLYSDIRRIRESCG